MGWLIVFLGLMLIAIGGFFVHYGLSIKDKVAQNVSIQQRALSPQTVKLLSIIYNYQKKFATSKLIIGRDGVLHFDDKDKRDKYKINIIQEVYGINSGVASKQNEFENLILNIPAEFLKSIPEARLNSPYVVQITDSGITYLRKEQ